MGNELRFDGRVAERLRTLVADEPVMTEDRSIAVTVSVGVALQTQHPGSTLDELLEDADAAMYRAKAGGRDQVCVE